MCLVTNETCLKISEKPIKCYKLLSKCNGGVYRTPTQLTPIPQSIINGKQNFKAFEADNKGVIHTNNLVYEYSWARSYSSNVGPGFIHCFSNKEDAIKALAFYEREKFLRASLRYSGMHYSLWEVEIPPQVYFVKGFNLYSNVENNSLNKMRVVAAHEIKFIREITNGKNKDNQ